MSIVLPDWVKSMGEEKGIPRLRYEMGKMEKSYPLFSFHIDEKTGALRAEGYLVTVNRNAYRIHIHFPEEYPFAPPLPVIMDSDVIKQYESGSFPHTRGKNHGGIAMCVIKPDDEHGRGWEPKLSSVTVVHFAAKWLHAYEVWQKRNRWILPEA